MACSPLVSFAHAVLRTLPALRRLEWLLEIESLTRRHPVGLAFSMLYVLWRGLRVTPLGHIGTDPIIYPLLGAISGFNPFLGLVCGALYGVGDLAQKFVWPDIYGARGWTDKNYWGAMGGYLVAYSSLMIMGVLPGLLSRVFRTVTRSIIRNYMFRRAAASADGATPLDEGTYPLAEMLAGAAGGFAGGYYAMHQVAPYTESPAFYWRPVPDNSCHHLEVGTHLKGRADVGGAGSAFGGLGPTVAPPRPLVDRGPYTPPPKPPKSQDPSLQEPPNVPPTSPLRTPESPGLRAEGQNGGTPQGSSSRGANGSKTPTTGADEEPGKTSWDNLDKLTKGTDILDPLIESVKQSMEGSPELLKAFQQLKEQLSGKLLQDRILNFDTEEAVQNTIKELEAMGKLRDVVEKLGKGIRGISLTGDFVSALHDSAAPTPLGKLVDALMYTGMADVVDPLLGSLDAITEIADEQHGGVLDKTARGLSSGISVLFDAIRTGEIQNVDLQSLQKYLAASESGKYGPLIPYLNQIGNRMGALSEEAIKYWGQNGIIGGMKMGASALDSILPNIPPPVRPQDMSIGTLP